MMATNRIYRWYAAVRIVASLSFLGGIFMPSFFNVSVLRAAGSTVRINEVCWMGSSESTNHEWLELRNDGDNETILDGWSLEAADGAPLIKLNGRIEANGYFLLERTSDASAADVTADLIYTGILGNAGEKLVLKDADGVIVETVDALPWPAGDNDSKQTMSRNSDGSWSNSVAVGGTPRRENAAETKIADDAAGAIVPGTASSVVEAPTNSDNVEDQNIILSEFVSSPESGADEWLELFNAGTGMTDLAGWSIKDASGAKTSLIGTINQGTYLIIEKISGKLNNDGDVISLFDQSGRLVDSVAYGMGALKVPEKGASLARINEWKFGRAALWQVTKTITKNQENILGVENKKIEIKKETVTIEREDIVISTSSVTKYSNEIYLSEVYPNPDKDVFEEEWIEICNRGTSSVDLAAWQLDDEVKGSRAFLLSDVLVAAGTCVVIRQEQSGLILNNDGDQVRLIQPDGKVADAVEYGKAPRGQSFARQMSGGWTWTLSPTLGAKNLFPIVSSASTDSTQASSIRSSKNKTSKTKLANSTKKTKAATAKSGLIRVVGTVVSLPGSIGNQYFYISGASVKQVYSFKKLFPKLQLGDEVEVIGELSESSSISRIKTKIASNVRVIKHGVPAVALIAKSEELEEVSVGSLVEVDGEVIDKKGASIFLDDQSGEVKIYFKKNGTKYPSLKKGDKVTVRGILEDGSTGLRIVPRGADDVELATSTANDFTGEVQGAFMETGNEWTLASRNGDDKKIYIILGFVMVGVCLWFGWRTYMKYI